MIDVICQGDSYEMGRAQGSALRGEIRAAAKALRDLEVFHKQKPWWLPFPIYRSLAGRKAKRLLADPLEREYPEFSRRLHGLAKGAGVPVGVPYLFNALEPLLSYVGGLTVCPGACSAVSVRGSRSATGEPMIGRNFDYLPIVQPFYITRECRPTEGYRTLEFTVAPLVGAVDGINERGLSITYDYAYTTDVETSTPIPISVLIGETLNRCTTVTEAAEWMSSRPRWGGGLLMLADADGDLASLELSSTRSHLRRPEPGEDVLFHTNCFSCPAMREVQIPDNAIYGTEAPKPLQGRRVHKSSDLRNQRYRELLKGNEPIDDARLLAIMSDHGPTGVPDDFTPCVHGSYWFTTATMQFFPRRRQMRVAFSTACQARFTELTL